MSQTFSLELPQAFEHRDRTDLRLFEVAELAEVLFPGLDGVDEVVPDCGKLFFGRAAVEDDELRALDADFVSRFD